jgi:alkylated DNA repair dioxygenase AlkB
MPAGHSQDDEARPRAIGERSTRQLDLLVPGSPPIEGFLYQPDLVSVHLERHLVAHFAELDFKEFEFRGYFGKRRVVSFGVRYDFNDSRMHAAPDIPNFLWPLRQLAARFAGLEAPALQHALITEYRPGAAIGWHRDRPAFKDVVGISLLSPCRFRLRCRSGKKWHRQTVTLEPRSAYLLRGVVREQWEHSIPASDSLRYSVTFRSLKNAEA